MNNEVRAQLFTEYVQARNYEKEQRLVHEVRHAKLRGEKVLIACGTREQVQRLKRKYPDLKGQIRGPKNS